MRRVKQNRSRSAKQFNKGSKKTRPINMVMRGGIRL